MKRKEERKEVFEKISFERDYQDHMCALEEIPQQPSVEGELVMLQSYVNKAMQKWTDSQSDRPTLNEIRKIASIAVRCLENHGCPRRDGMKSFSSFLK